MDTRGARLLRGPVTHWRPTSRARADLAVAAPFFATSWLTTLISPELGIGGMLVTPPTLAARAWKRHQRTLAARAAYRTRAYAVLDRQARLQPPRQWGDGHPADQLVHVYPEDWAELRSIDPMPEVDEWTVRWREWRKYRTRQRYLGLRIVPQRVTLGVPPGSIINWRLFRRHWNEVHGFQEGAPPWRWDKRRSHDYIVGEPFDLPELLPTPDLPHWDPMVSLLGILEDGTPLEWNRRLLPHMLVGGSTRFGKTACLRNIGYQALASEACQALVIFDPKGGEYPTFDVPGAWDPARCLGVHVASDDLDADGRFLNLDNQEAAMRALLGELGRRRQAYRDFGILPQSFVMVEVDEAAQLLIREQVASQDNTDEGQRRKRRNAQRAEIESGIKAIVMLGAAFRMFCVCAAQSPRREFLPGDAIANMAMRLYIGPADNVELGIIFDAPLPESPPTRVGWAVWKDARDDADPLDPYLFAKLNYLDPDRVVFEERELEPVP